MFELKVLGIAKAKQLIGQDWPTHIISIINDGGPHWFATTIDRQHDNHYIFKFNDVEGDLEEADDELRQACVVPTYEMMKDIMESLEFMELNEDSKLLVHCSAGKSRSTAIAIAAMVKFGGLSPEDAVAQCRIYSPAMCPNRLMIHYLDDIIGAKGELEAAVAKYYEERIIFFPALTLPNRGGLNQ